MKNNLKGYAASLLLFTLGGVSLPNSARKIGPRGAGAMKHDCRFALGLAIGAILSASAMALAEMVVSVDTSGRLVGYVVQNEGVEICKDPMVWNKFRGPTSYIVCD